MKQKSVGAYKPRLDGVHHHGGCVVHPQLLHDVFPVGVHRVAGQEELVRDLYVGQSL